MNLKIRKLAPFGGVAIKMQRWEVILNLIIRFRNHRWSRSLKVGARIDRFAEQFFVCLGRFCVEIVIKPIPMKLNLIKGRPA